MGEYKLIDEIIKRSISKIWDSAKYEWSLNEVYEAEEPDTCLCGHYPILEMCVLKNKTNAHVVTVGNSCVKKFLGLPSDKIFQAVKRVRKDNNKSLNAETITYAFEHNWISENDRSFYLNVRCKRKLSEKQLKWKMDINKRVLTGMRKK